MRRGTSRYRDTSLFAVFGIFVAVYAAIAGIFYWFMQPTVATNRGLAAYSPPPSAVVRYADAPWVPPDPSDTTVVLTPRQRTQDLAPSSASAPAPKTESKTREARAPARREHAARARPAYNNYAGRPYNAFAFRPWF